MWGRRTGHHPKSKMTNSEFLLIMRGFIASAMQFVLFPLRNVPILTTVLLIGIAVRSAHAPIDRRYAKGKLINVLVEHGMTDLLEHLIATEPPDDLGEAGELVYRIHLSRWVDPAMDLDRRQKQLLLAADKIRALVKRHNQHESRPIWQTDLAEILMFQVLDLENIAGMYYEFGVTTVAQRTVFEQAVPEALEQLSDAMQRLFVLKGELPKETDHVATRVDTGKWDRLMSQYYAIRTPFYLGQACLYMAMLPTDHPFYASPLKPNAKIPLRGQTVVEEHHRIIRQGLESLQPLIGADHDPHGVYAGSLSLAARLLMLDDKSDEAIKLLQKAIKVGGMPSVTDLAARLALAQALGLKADYDAAETQIEELNEHPAVKEDLVARLLVVDARHRLLMALAQRVSEPDRYAMIERAYQVYDELFNNIRRSPRAQELKDYVYQRWAEGIGPQQDLGLLPSMMLIAAGRITIDKAETLREQALESVSPQTDRLHREASGFYQRAARIYHTLGERTNLSRLVRAEVTYHQVLVQYRTNETDMRTKLESIRGWTKLADEMPDQRVAELAITQAAKLMQTIFVAYPSDPDTQALYEEVTGVLFEKYPRTDASDEHRIYYAQSILIPSERYADAVRTLDGVKLGPDNQLFYFTAGSDLLFCYQKMVQRAGVRQHAQLGEQLRSAAGRLAQQARVELEHEKEPKNIEAISTAMAWAHLSMAMLHMDESQVDAAMHELSAIDTLVIPKPLEIAARASLIVGLAKLGRLAEARIEAEHLMDTSPHDAAPVIHEVLQQIGGQIETWRLAARMPRTASEHRRTLRDKARTSAASVIRLADMLVAWVRQQPNVAAAWLASCRLIEARTKAAAGLHGPALIILDDIRRAPQFGNDLAVLDTLGDVHYQAAMLDSDEDRPPNESQVYGLIESAGYYDRILTGVEPDGTGTFPNQWWNAWAKRLQINDILNRGTEETPLRVKQLRLTDPNLGGEPYRSELEYLANKRQVTGQ